MKKERGFSLIEVLIAIALLGIVAIAVLGGLSTASKALFLADEKATAESLARSQMEWIKNHDYAFSYSAAISQDDIDAGYSATIVSEPIIGQIDLQKITVTINHHGEEAVILEGYKANR